MIKLTVIGGPNTKTFDKIDSDVMTPIRLAIKFGEGDGTDASTKPSQGKIWKMTKTALVPNGPFHHFEPLTKSGILANDTIVLTEV